VGQNGTNPDRKGEGNYARLKKKNPSEVFTKEGLTAKTKPLHLAKETGRSCFGAGL